MSISEIEDLIIKKLEEAFPKFLVQGFPEKPQEFIFLFITEVEVIQTQML